MGWGVSTTMRRRSTPIGRAIHRCDTHRVNTGAGLWVRAELRRHWPALLLLAVLCGVVVAVVLTAVAGARRTTTAYDRFLDEGDASHADVLMMTGFHGRSDIDLGNGKTADDVMAELRSLPQVEALDRLVGLLLGPEGMDFFNVIVSLDGYAVNRPRVLDGRLPQGSDEVALSRRAAEVLGKRVGDAVELQGQDPRQFERFFVEGDTSVLQEEPEGPQVVLEVVGVVEGVGDIGRVDLADPYGIVTPELYDRYRDAIAQFGPGVVVRLRNGFRDVPGLRAEIQRLAGDSELVSVEDKRHGVDAVNNAVDVQALALLVFAGVAAAAGLVALGTAVTRQLGRSGADVQILGALGLTRRRCTVALGTVAAPVVTLGVVLGVVGAVAASPLLPMGLAGQAEPHPGLVFDAVALPLGALALAVVLTGIVGFSAWRTTRTMFTGRGDEGTRQNPSMVTRLISKAGVGAVGATGLTLAFEPGSPTRPVPTRAALTAAVLATAGVAAVLVFGASLANVVAKPELSGFPWHAAATGGSSSEDASETVATAVDDPAVDAVTVTEVSETTVAGERTQLLGTRAAKGSVGLTIVEGRAPTTPDEVAVGPKTLKRLGKDHTDQIELATEGGGARSYRIVGTAIFPTVISHTDYDNGIWLTDQGFSGLQAPQGDAVVLTSAVVLIRVAPGADVGQKRGELEELGFDFEAAGGPAKVANLDEVKGFPQALAVFVALLGLVTVGHALALSPRRRRGELAVLRTLGFVRRQLGATLAVQATAVTAVGLVLGLPIGIAAGRGVWGLVANSLSVVPHPVVPPSILLVAPAAMVVANLMAVLPARRAASVRPAEILRAE